MNGNINSDTDNPLNASGVSKKSLVIFFVIDTSASMKGKKIGELNTVMEEVIPEIRKAGGADTDIKLAVLTFSTEAKWVYSVPISVENFEWIRLSASGVTSMGKAFEELAEKMSGNSFLSSPSLSFAPVIFLITDGYPSDDYKKGLKMLQSNSWFRHGMKVALGIGNETDDNMLKEFTGSAENVVYAYTGGQLAKMIKIVAVTASQVGSRSTTLTEENKELTENDVFASKQKLLGQQIQKAVSKDDDDFSFDTGW